VSDRAREVEAKFDQAQVHLEEVKTTIGRYMAQHFNGLTGDVKLGPDGGFHVAGVWPPPPWRLPVVIGDCVHDMRSGLEHIATYLVEVSSKATEHTTFPVMSVRNTANKAGVSPPPTVAGGIDPGARAVLDTLQPYVLESLYEQHPLWTLHEMWNHDKHRSLLVEAVKSPLWVREAYTAGDPALIGVTVPGRWERDAIGSPDDGARFDFVPDDPEMDVHAEFSFLVCFKEGSPGEGHGVCEVLNSCLVFVRDALRQLEPFL
jgi:hypothetical protein